MARAPRNDEAANHTIAIRATQGEKEALDRILARNAPGLSLDASRSDRFRRLILDLDGGVVVPLTKEDQAKLELLMTARRAEFARFGLRANVTPADVFVQLLAAATVESVHLTATAPSTPAVAVPLPAQSVLPFAAPSTPVAEHEASLAAEPVKAPVALAEPVKAPVAEHEASLAAEPVKAPVALAEPVKAPVAEHEASLAAEPVKAPVAEHEAAEPVTTPSTPPVVDAAKVRAAAQKAIEGGRSQADIRKAVVADGVELDSGLLSRFVNGKKGLSAEKLAALAKVLGL